MIEQIVNKEMISFTLQKDTFSSYNQLKDLNNRLYKANKLLRNGKALSQTALANITQHNMIDRLTVRFLINRVDLIPPIKEICSAGLAAKGRFFRRQRAGIDWFWCWRYTATSNNRPATDGCRSFPCFCGRLPKAVKFIIHNLPSQPLISSCGGGIDRRTWSEFR